MIGFLGFLAGVGAMCVVVYLVGLVAVGVYVVRQFGGYVRDNRREGRKRPMRGPVFRAVLCVIGWPGVALWLFVSECK